MKIAAPLIDGAETQASSLFQGGSALEKWRQEYDYDGAGRVNEITYPFCLAGCPATPRSQTVTYEMGRVKSVPGFANAITYHPNGLVKEISHTNGVTVTQTLDPNGMARPGSLGTNRTWQAESYFFDASGNIKQIGSKKFSYDLASRLTGATLPGASLPFRGYEYDVFGNLISVSQGSSAENLTSAVTYTTSTTTNRLVGAAYDGSGNLLSYQGSTYSWNVLGEITALNTGTEQWVHTYDATGERVWSWRSTPSRVDTYALRGLNNEILSDFTKSGSTYSWEDYVYREGQLLAARHSDGRLVHFNVDHLGSVRQETDAL